MNQAIYAAAQTVVLMDNHLRKELLIADGKIQEKKLWENTFIKHQIDRRRNRDTFSVNDHIRAMVYSMLSAGIVWDRVKNEIDLATGKILSIDEVFHQYSSDYLLECDPVKLRDEIKKLGCASQYTLKQMQTLIDVNIPKLLQLGEQYGSIDNFYRRFINLDKSLKTLVLVLSNENSVFKIEQMGAALIAEYLKNVGYNIAKPDRHIRRILGSDYLACSDKKVVPVYEAFDIVSAISKELRSRNEIKECGEFKMSAAEVDYILWSYCANGYGEICTANKPKCEKCVAKENCKRK